MDDEDRLKTTKDEAEQSAKDFNHAFEALVTSHYVLTLDAAVPDWVIKLISNEGKADGT